MLDAEHAIALGRRGVAQPLQSEDVAAAALDRLEPRHELVLALFVGVLLFQQDFGLIAQAVHGGGIVVQGMERGFQRGDPGSGVSDPRGQGSPVGFHLTGGRPVAVSFGGDAFPEVVLAITGGVTTGGLVERTPQ